MALFNLNHRSQISVDYFVFKDQQPKQTYIYIINLHMLYWPHLAFEETKKTLSHSNVYIIYSLVQTPHTHSKYKSIHIIVDDCMNFTYRHILDWWCATAVCARVVLAYGIVIVLAVKEKPSYLRILDVPTYFQGCLNPGRTLIRSRAKWSYFCSSRATTSPSERCSAI